jgi:predicted DCC family thiol-disulfide oxidoreductase YuxK
VSLVDGPSALTVVYDESCALCRRARDWLTTQPCRVPVELVPAGAPETGSRFPELVPWLGKDLVVVDDRGRAWIGSAAFLTCLWATARYRKWAYRLARPRLAPLTERFFLRVSRRRHRWGARLDPDVGCSWCDTVRLGAGDVEQ